ncbi:MAG TPA: tetratricopeptide repeat protein [Opitutaceae bacterium]|jgi:tetratricopeptide (TPR) repeat protein|nr:tetratricopeptide repeat protein [Opitutaceae bacterium]
MPGADMNESRSTHRYVLLCCLLIGAAALLAYSDSFRGPFVYDDVGSITENRSIHHLATAWSPPYRAGQTVGGRPVLNLSFALNYALGGLEPSGYHALNLLIHLFAGLILFGLVRRTLELRSETSLVTLGAGLSAALLWTLHPLQTEAVTYVVQRAESLMGLFYLLTLYCFVRRWHVLAFAACLLGMGAKEVMISAPVIVFFYDRAFVSGTFREAWRRHRWVHLSLAATWIPLAALILGAHHRGGSIGQGVTWWGYALTQFPGILLYLRLMLWPRPLIFDYGAEWVKGAGPVLASLACGVIVLGLLGISAWLFFRPRRPGARGQAWMSAGFLGLCFFAFLAPTSLMPGNRQTLAEHRLYLPLAAILAGGSALLGTTAGRRRPVLCAAAVALLALAAGAATHTRNHAYRDLYSLWGDTVAKRPDNPFAHNNYGVELYLRAEYAAALPEYQAALRLKPDYPEAHNNMGNWLRREGRLPEARAELSEALRLKPDYAEAYSNLGFVEALSGRHDQAMADFRQALELKPAYVEAMVNLGSGLGQEGRMEEAAAEFRAALELEPASPEAHNDLGVALANLGRPEEARREFLAALHFRPDYPNAAAHLARLPPAP